MNLLTTFAQSYYNSDYDPSYYSSSSSLSDAEAAGIMVFFLLLTMIIAIAVYVVLALLMSRIFKKAGIEQWKAWVPFYNQWILLEMGGQKGFWAVLQIIPIVNIVSAVFTIIAMYHIGLKFGKEDVFVLWAIFIPIVWYIWLAVDDSTWQGDEKKVKQQPAFVPEVKASNK